MALFSETKKNVNTPCWESVGFLRVKPSGKLSNHWTLQC